METKINTETKIYHIILIILGLIVLFAIISIFIQYFDNEYNEDNEDYEDYENYKNNMMKINNKTKSCNCTDRHECHHKFFDHMEHFGNVNFSPDYGWLSSHGLLPWWNSTRHTRNMSYDLRGDVPIIPSYVGPWLNSDLI